MGKAGHWWRDYDIECNAWSAERDRISGVRNYASPDGKSCLSVGPDRSFVEFKQPIAWTCSHCNASGVGGFHGCDETGRYVFDFSSTHPASP